MKKFANLAGLLGAWALLFTFFSILLPTSFPNLANFETLLRQSVIVGFGAIGMTYVIVSGNIDLSAGSAIALVTVVIALALHAGWSPISAMAIGIAAGALCGCISGILVSRFKVGAFIVTLAGLLAWRGVAKGLAGEQKVNAPMTWLSDFTAALGPQEKWKLLPLGAWLLIVCAVAASWALRYTVFGRHVVAVGSNELAARLSGVRVARVKTLVYVLSGVCLGLSGLMQFSRLTVGDPTVATGVELDIIAAVVIGGASLSGGEGSVAGSLIGALIMTTIRAGCSQKGWDNWVQEIVTGMIILIAVGVDRWRLSRRST